MDITKLPPRSFIEDIYGLDSQIDEKRISLIGEGYERKIELFRTFQLGQDLHKRKLAVKDYRKPTINTEEFVIKNEGESKGLEGSVRRKKGRQKLPNTEEELRKAKRNKKSSSNPFKEDEETDRGEYETI